MQLYLIRHPAPDVAPGICYGRTDLPLAEDVAAVAARIRPQLPPHVEVFTSPLQRCRHLANVLHASPRSDPRLQEMNFGDWEMRAWNVVQREALDGWAADPLGFAPPAGESVAQLRERVLAFVAEARRDGLQHAALVTHAGVMKVLVGHARKLPVRQWMALGFDYGCVLSIDLDDAMADD